MTLVYQNEAKSTSEQVFVSSPAPSGHNKKDDEEDEDDEDRPVSKRMEKLLKEKQGVEAELLSKTNEEKEAKGRGNICFIQIHLRLLC